MRERHDRRPIYNNFRLALLQAALIGGLTSAAIAADYPALGPLPPVPFPPDNPITRAKVALGKTLFWDGRLSGNGSMPCVVCHSPDQGWGNGTAISFGYTSNQHWRNSQTIYNSAYYSRNFWDGSAPGLVAQAKAAATGAVGGNGDSAMMEMRLRAVPEYVREFKKVFGTMWPNINDAWRAIAAFERTIVSDPKKVPFDRYMNGNKTAIGAAAKRGLAVFKGKANCIACHNGPLFSDQELHNLGVPQNSVFKKGPLYQIAFRYEIYAKGVSESTYRSADHDLGYYFVTKNPKDKGKFRTPSLREIKYTGPYMHDGVFGTLTQVIDFYDRGGGSDPNKDARLKPLHLSAAEKRDLLAFLNTLSMDKPLLMEDPELPATATFPKGE